MLNRFLDWLDTGGWWNIWRAVRMFLFGLIPIAIIVSWVGFWLIVGGSADWTPIVIMSPIFLGMIAMVVFLLGLITETLWSDFRRSRR